MTTQIVHNKLLTFERTNLDEILLELYQKVSDGNFHFWLSVFISLDLRVEGQLLWKPTHLKETSRRFVDFPIWKYIN